MREEKGDGVRGGQKRRGKNGRNGKDICNREKTMGDWGCLLVLQWRVAHGVNTHIWDWSLNFFCVCLY